MNKVFREAEATPKPVKVTRKPSNPQHPPTPSNEKAVAAQKTGTTQEAVEMNANILENVQDKATVLMQERKRGKTVLEKLAPVEQVRESLDLAATSNTNTGLPADFQTLD